jgi:uncharacterized membrane protein (UPF0127 family)
VAILAAVALTSALVACDDRPRADADAAAYATAVAWDTTTIRLVTRNDTVPLRVELATTREQQTMGLMERRVLGADEGMLFVYDSIQPADAGFWMYRTRIPLDIAFADSAGVIRAIRSMVPCETTLPEGCPVYAAGVPYRYALEVNAGYFRRHGAGVGDRLLVAEPRSAD